MRIGAHPSVALGRKFGQFRFKAAILIEKFLGLVAFHPTLKLLDVTWMLGIHQNRHLVRPEGALYLQAIHFLRPSPTLGGPENDHGPARPGSVTLVPRIFLDSP